MLDDYKHIKPKVGDDYFDQFSKMMMDKIHDEDIFDLKEEAPILYKLGKAEGFKVPNGYFQSLVMPKQPQKLGLFRSMNSMHILSIAAGFVLIAACYFLMQPTMQDTEQSISFEEVNDQEIFAEILNDRELTEDLYFEEWSSFDEKLEDAEIESLIEGNFTEFDLLELEELL